MARIKGGMNAKKRHNRVLKMAKGYRGARSKQYRVAKQSAAARINGLSYSVFMHGLKLAGVDLNRKVLADMAVNDAEGFAKLAELAKAKVA